MIKEIKINEIVCDCCGSRINESYVIGVQAINRNYITLGDFHICSNCIGTILKEIWKSKRDEISMQEIISKAKCYTPRVFDGSIVKGFL